jgi:hypothetical protein
MSDLPGDHFDYNTVPISVGVLVSKQNAFFLERVELEETLRKVQTEIQRSDEACADLRKAIKSLGFDVEPAEGLIHTCKGKANAKRRRVS